MRGERARDSFQATALVHEAYLRLVDTQHVNWQNRAHFLAMAARLMRRILVDLARARQYQKRGGGAIRVSFTDALSVPDKQKIWWHSTRRCLRSPGLTSEEAASSSCDSSVVSAWKRPRPLRISPERSCATGSSPERGCGESCGNDARAMAAGFADLS